VQDYKLDALPVSKPLVSKHWRNMLHLTVYLAVFDSCNVFSCLWLSTFVLKIKVGAGTFRPWVFMRLLMGQRWGVQNYAIFTSFGIVRRFLQNMARVCILLHNISKSHSCQTCASFGILWTYWEVQFCCKCDSILPQIKLWECQYISGFSGDVFAAVTWRPISSAIVTPNVHHPCNS